MTQHRTTKPRRGPYWAPARTQALTMATLYGLAVIPLTRAKLPAIPAAHPDGNPCTGQCGALGHGIHDASSEPVQVRRLFDAASWAAGYAIACGRAPHHLFGLDLDRKNGADGVAALHALARTHGFTVPQTVTVATQSGGLHLWLTAPAGTRVPNTAGALAPGIDTRGSGGYLVGPGSLGPRGRYRLTTSFSHTPIAPAPPAIMTLLNSRLAAVQEGPGPTAPGGGSGRPESRLAGLVRVVLNCGPNDLNNRLYWAARTAFEADDIDPETATAHLLAAAVERGHPETPARRTIASAAKGAARSRQETLS
ncbi:bifunctional DNA primase/polymerase [Streptomyces sp. GMY02]|uniref:bifunctional DNA primase/polymerase n=1 Tax=Streptomyces sp. GMY02 TaxID=1333528 RepID=UPI001C2BCD8C|nr:bifunctional DNA primase/polymerase [Streptomyces sp. GMY02]QXE35888.1 bifunctional DNA primase/polymerase [Streptomyces sp. GMY02]